ncbi:hypothetical protein FOZ60_004153 [Perkinsus olseni]|uniref:Uncharacterized protein n=1 Tax=Perkinsus olseni TaxID=32597 RepID=A0A7J6NTT7_PEROL|nr:hypothetical protein FOZ60_004153 [Perkinsus olseni]
MDPSHRDLAIRAADGGGDAVLLEALLEDIDIGSMAAGPVYFPHAPQALSPRAAWPEHDHEDLSVVEPLVSACREMEALEGQALATLWSDYEQPARARLEGWQERRDASAQRWADAKHSLRGGWQDEALLSAESSDAEDRQELPSSASAAGLEAACDDHHGVAIEEGGTTLEEPASLGGLLDGTQIWEALTDRIGEVLRMASEKGQALETEEADLDVEEGVLIPQDPPQSSCYSDSRPTGAKADTSQTISREDRPMTVVDVVRPALPSQGTEAVAPLPKEVPQSAWASSQARRRELSCMVQEDALVAAQASATEHERGRLTLEDTFALRYRQWQLYQQGRSLSSPTPTHHPRLLSPGGPAARAAARAWLQRQHAERVLMTIADDQSAAHRMEDRREVEGRRMLRAMHESRAYRIHLKALQRNRDAMVVEDSAGRERRESLWMAQEERPSSWWRSADRAVTVIARAVRETPGRGCTPSPTAADTLLDQIRRLAALRIQACWRGNRDRGYCVAALLGILRAVVVNDGGGVVDTVRLSWLPTAEGVLSCHVISSEDPGSLQRLSSTAKVSCPITNSKPEDIRYSSIGERYLHNPTVELGEVDLTDILRAEEGISSLFPDRPTLLVPYRTGEETDEPAGRKPNDPTRQHDTTEEEDNSYPLMECSRGTSPLLPDINSHRSTTSSRLDTTASSSRRSSTAEEIYSRAAASEQVVPLPPILPRGRSAVVAWRTPTPSVHQDALQAEEDAPAHPSLTGLVARRPSRIAGPGKDYTEATTDDQTVAPWR